MHCLSSWFAERRRRRGGNSIEFALLFPFFVLLLLGVCDIGWLFFQQSALDQGVNAGCRVASLMDPGPEDEFLTDLEDEGMLAAIDAVAGTGGGDCAGCTFTLSAFGDALTRSLLCQMSREIDPLTGIVLTDLNLDAQTAVRLEFQWAQED